MLQRLYDYVARLGGAEVLDRGLTYPLFVELLDHVAQNCVYTTKNVYGAVSRVRTMFHVMNSSRGRIKLAKGTNASIIPPLSGLDSTDPTLYKSPSAPSQQSRGRTLRKSRSQPNSPRPPPGGRGRTLARKGSSSAPTTPEYTVGEGLERPSSASSKGSRSSLHTASTVSSRNQIPRNKRGQRLKSASMGASPPPSPMNGRSVSVNGQKPDWV